MKVLNCLVRNGAIVEIWHGVIPYIGYLGPEPGRGRFYKGCMDYIRPRLVTVT